MTTPNPAMPADPFVNPFQLSNEQYTFVYTHYPEYSSNPHDIIGWLYNMALYNEE